VACTNAQPEDGFRLPASDTYIFAKWRGEWFDCYSLPSGTNNVIHGLPGDDLRGHVVLWTLAALMLLIGWGVRPFRGRRKQAVTDPHRAA
jgi:hypothetical protein